jgi:Domain of unknown function (DUF4159)
MRRTVTVLIVLALLVCEARAVTDGQVGEAIERMQAYLLSRQDAATGGWEQRYASSSRHRGGESALVAFALLRSGMSVQEPKMRAAAVFLQGVPMNGTYAVSLRAHCWAAMPDEYRTQLARDARWLLNAQVQGLFDYGPRTGPRFDHSLTQYGLLGLWESAKRRGPTAGRVWHDAARHFIEVQNPDGGWGYQTGNGSTATMTAAGLTALLIAQESLYLGRNRPPDDLAQAIEGGIVWLGRDIRTNGLSARGSRRMYYLASLERVALASGIKTLGGQDWFDRGAQAILERENGTGSLDGGLVDTAFALLYLSRGRAPAWINKLRLPGRSWNNRPNDLNILTRHMSDVLETELNWQVVDANSDTALWLNAPVAYIASDQPPHLSAVAEAGLKTYLDLGGVLVASPDNSSQAFIDSIRRLTARLYPGYELKRAGADHPLLGLVFPVDLPEESRPWILSNGVRDLIVLAPTDWGMSLQSGRLEPKTDALQIMTNLHALVTDRGGAGGRLRSPFVARNDVSPVGKLVVLRAAEPDRPEVEPLAWQPMRNRFFNRTGLELVTRYQPLERAPAPDVSLVYLGGVEAERLSPAEMRALVGFVNRGGTVLVESIGGRGDYAGAVLRQLQAVFDAKAAPLAADHPIVTGVGLPGGYDQRVTAYRRFTVLNMSPADAPRLVSIDVAGRSVVIGSHEDLSLGVLGARRWGVNGYGVESAREILTNILLYAAVSKTPIHTSKTE